MVLLKRVTAPPTELPEEAVLNAIYSPILVDEIAKSRQEGPVIGHMMAQYFEMQERGRRGSNEDYFLHNNLLGERL